jgi:transcriptional regulator with XRE-family HTH domain
MGKRLTTAREQLGLSPDEVAARLGISRRSYLAWEQGKRQRWTQMCINLYYTAKLQRGLADLRQR